MTEQSSMSSTVAQEVMESESNACQSSPTSPWPESDLTEEETMYCLPGGRVSRVLHLFEFQRNGVAVSLPIGKPEVAFEGITAVGVVGTLIGKAGLFAQCGWFGTYDLDWFWCRITDIKQAELKSDIQFRGGDQCVWVSSAHGDYALLVPGPTYMDLWEETLHSYGPEARIARIGVWPAQGTRPDWWNRRWKDSWPWDKDAEDMETDGDGDSNMDVSVGTSRSASLGWPRLGPHGDQRFSGEPLCHLHVLSPWVISPNGLMVTKDSESGR